MFKVCYVRSGVGHVSGIMTEAVAYMYARNVGGIVFPAETEVVNEPPTDRKASWAAFRRQSWDSYGVARHGHAPRTIRPHF